MSKGSCIAIGITAIACCIGFIFIGILVGDFNPHGGAPVYAVAAFFGIMALACLVESSRPLTLRVLGAAVCGAYACGVYFFVTTRRHVAIGDVFGLIVGFAAFGMPAAYLTFTGTYPKWGRLSNVFRHNENADRDPHFPENE